MITSIENVLQKSFIKTGKFLSLAVFLFIIAFVAVPQVKAVTIGVIPPSIDAKSVLIGGKQTKNVLIQIGDQHINAVKFNVRFRGDYGQFLEGPNELIIPIGHQEATYYFNINAHELGVGNYSAFIDFLVDQPPTTDVATSGSGASVVAGLTIPVSFAVSGDQVLDYSIISFQVIDTEINKPLYLSYNIYNNGNILFKPEKIEITCQDIEDDTNVKTYIINGDELDFTPAGENSEVSLRLNHDLIEGTYIANAKFYYNNEVVESLDSQQFRVFASGTLQQQGELVDVTTNKNEYAPGENIKIDATFSNTGDIPVKSVLVTEIVDVNNSIKDLLRSNELEINKKEKGTLSIITSILEPGTYTLNSYVEYGNKKTAVENNTITVIEDKSGLKSTWGSVIALVLIIVIIFFIVFFLKRRKKKEEETKVKK
ncbi:MAG: hypothetical protein V1898_00005 [Patescibacteria group bacterium]